MVAQVDGRASRPRPGVPLDVPGPRQAGSAARSSTAAYGGVMAYLLVPSPLLGPATWAPVADLLDGRVAAVDDARGCGRRPGRGGAGRAQQRRALRAAAGVPGVDARATVYVDAALAGDGPDTALAPPRFLEFLESLAGDDGVLPPWTQWWEDDDVARALPRRRHPRRRSRPSSRGCRSRTSPRGSRCPPGWADRPLGVPRVRRHVRRGDRLRAGSRLAGDRAARPAPAPAGRAGRGRGGDRGPAPTRAVSARIRASSSRRLSRRTTTSTTSMPPLGLASACSSSGRRADPPVRGPGRGAEGGEVDAVGRAEEPLEAVGVRRVALLEHREDRAAVVVDDHDRQVGHGLAGPDDQAVGVVQERHVAHQRERPRAVRAGRARRRSRSRSVPSMPGQAAVGDHLAARADLVARHHQVEVADRAGRADDQQPAGRERPADRAGHLVRREVGLGGEQRVELARRRWRRRRATPRARPGRRRSSTCGTTASRSSTGNGRSVQTPARRACR